MKVLLQTRVGLRIGAASKGPRAVFRKTQNQSRFRRYRFKPSVRSTDITLMGDRAVRRAHQSGRFARSSVHKPTQPLACGPGGAQTTANRADNTTMGSGKGWGPN